MRGVYEKLYAPVIFDALLYLDAHKMYNAMQDVVEGAPARLINRIDAHVAEHLSLASPRLIAAYYETRRHRFIDDDMRGYRHEFAQRRFLLTLVVEFAEIARRLGFFERYQRKEIERYTALYQIWSIGAHLYGDDRSTALLRLVWMVDENRMGRWFRRSLRRLDAQSARAPGKDLGNYRRELEEILVQNAGPDASYKGALRSRIAEIR